jgi:2-polyprenyl-3-methyl-5-hydroxy-6-metoxy-1,4-benzoquinol methylase
MSFDKMAPQNISDWTADSLRRALDRMVAQAGPWTSHSIHLGHGVYTREPEVNWRVELFGRIMSDFGISQLAGTRILDLACLEGIFAIEFARRGATTVGIEGRRANVEKCVFACDILGLTGCTILRDDVRNLRSLALGEFDVVFCAGILYHLDANDAMGLIHQISASCRKLAIFDTHIAPPYLINNPFSLSDPMSPLTLGGRVYEGRYFQEHVPGANREQKESKLWASLDNDRSFWFSRPSLYHALQAGGFSAIYDAFRDVDRPIVETDRVIFVALK